MNFHEWKLIFLNFVHCFWTLWSSCKLWVVLSEFLYTFFISHTSVCLKCLKSETFLVAPKSVKTVCQIVYDRMAKSLIFIKIDTHSFVCSSSHGNNLKFFKSTYINFSQFCELNIRAMAKLWVIYSWSIYCFIYCLFRPT